MGLQPRTVRFDEVPEFPSRRLAIPSAVRRYASPLLAFLVGLTLAWPAASWAAQAATPGQVLCPAGADLVVHAGGTWDCGPAPTTPPSSSTTVPPTSTTTVPPTSSSTTVPPTSTTTTPPPSSSTTTPPAGNGCLARLAECGYPNAANTGPHGTLTLVNGDVTLRAGAVYENREVHGCIHVTGPGVTIRNVRVIAPTAACVVGIEGSARNPGAARLTVTDAELVCTVNGTEPGLATASGDRNFTFLRVNIHGCINGFDIDFEATIQDSWIHDLSCLGDDPHSDGLQVWPGATNILVDHSVIDTEPGAGFCTTSAIITGAGDQVTVRNSLLAGGAYTLYCRGGSSLWSVTNNRFGTAAYGTNTECLNVASWMNNVRDADGSIVLRAG